MADAELAGAAADGKGEYAGYTNDGDQQGQRGESTKDNGVEAVWSHDFGANVIEGAGALNGLVRCYFVDFARNGGNERVRIVFGAHKQAAIHPFLIGRLVHGHGRGGDEVFVVHIGNHGDDAARFVADANKSHDRIGPAQSTIYGILAGEELFGDALTDDDDAFGTVAIAVIEIAALQDGQAESFEESGRDGTETRAGIILTVFARGALDGERKLDAERTRIAPRDAEAGRDMFDAGNGGDTMLNITIEVADLFGGASVGHCRQIHG